jgi:AraC-like DNA-binding protein
VKAVFEPIRPHENHSFFVRDLMEPVFSAPWHYHPELELTLILNGSGLRFVGDSAEPFGKWDFVLIGSNLPHFWRILGDPPKPQSHAVVAQFKTELFDLRAFPELNNICLLLAGCARGLWFYSRTAQHLQKRFESIPHLKGAARLACLIDTLEALAFERLKGRFQTLSSEGFAPDLDTLTEVRIRKACEFIFTRFHLRLRLIEIARSASMTQWAFCRFFHHNMGMGVFEFIHRVRTGHASRLLMETDSKIIDIAFDCGYQNLSNFNRWFLAIRGETPSAFRKRWHASSNGHIKPREAGADAHLLAH